MAEIRGKIEAGGGSGSSSITDRNFEEALREVTTFVEKLHQASLRSSSPSSGALARFREFQNELRAILRLVAEIVNKRVGLNEAKETSERNNADSKVHTTH